MIYLLFLIYLILFIIAWIKPKWSLFFILALIPFHAFLITSLGHFLNLTSNQQDLLSLWKEIILASISMKLIWQILKNQKTPFKILFVDKLIYALFILALIIILVYAKDFKIALLGLRYDFEMFLMYFIIRSFEWTEREIKISVIIILITGFIVSLFAIFQGLINPNILTHFGYTNSANYFPGSALPAAQQIGGSGVFRAQSFLAGPNQLGSYLLILLSICFVGSILEKGLKFKSLFLIPGIFGIVALFFTYSRSAWLSFILILILGTIFWAYYFKSKKTALFLGLTYVILAVIASLFAKTGIFGQRFTDVFILHQGSTQERITRINDSINSIIHHPFGLGIGKAGLAPQVLNGQTFLITENWFLQIAGEMGILGLLFYIAITFEFFRNLINTFKENIGKFIHPHVFSVFLAFSGLTFYSLFLHTWSDISTTLTFWFLMGLVFSQNKKFIKEAYEN